MLGVVLYVKYASIAEDEKPPKSVYSSGSGEAISPVHAPHHRVKFSDFWAHRGEGNTGDLSFSVSLIPISFVCMENIGMDL